MPDFVPGLDLCGRFYREVVRPILGDAYPRLPYSAALLGYGSDVLGFDTEMSTDHDWGPRLLLFLREDDQARLAQPLRDLFAQRLPREFLGYPTGFRANANGTGLAEVTEEGPIEHRIAPLTIAGLIRDYLAFDIRQEIEAADWLTFPEQKLRTLVAGAVYHDGIGLQAVRDRFSYYPHDIWLYLLACGWTRIGQEEHFVGRTGIVGDEIGSALIASRLVCDLIRLCFLMERQYAPYAKWFGTAFARLECAGVLAPLLQRVLTATTWQERERCLCPAYEQVAAMHNALGVTEALPEKVGLFHDRPFQVIHAVGGFAPAIRARIQDPAIRQIAERKPIGSIDQFSDSTDLVSDPIWRPTLRRLYE